MTLKAQTRKENCILEDLEAINKCFANVGFVEVNQTPFSCLFSV